MSITHCPAAAPAAASHTLTQTRVSIHSSSVERQHSHAAQANAPENQHIHPLRTTKQALISYSSCIVSLSCSNLLLPPTQSSQPPFSTHQQHRILTHDHTNSTNTINNNIRCNTPPNQPNTLPQDAAVESRLDCQLVDNS